MSIRQPLRTLSSALVFIVGLVLIRGVIEREPPPVPADDEFGPPAIRVARDTLPTIVEPNENWLNSAALAPGEDAEGGLTPDQGPYLPTPRVSDSEVIRR